MTATSRYLYLVRYRGIIKFGKGGVNRMHEHLAAGAVAVQVLEADEHQVAVAEQRIKDRFRALRRRDRRRGLLVTFGTGTEVLPLGTRVDLTDFLPGGVDVTAMFARDSAAFRMPTEPRHDSTAAYLSFTEPARPISIATQAELVEDLWRITGVEGPLLGGRLLKIHQTASGGIRVRQRSGDPVKSALARAVRDGVLVESDPLGDYFIGLRTYRLPDQPAVRPRPLGPRTVSQVPPMELAHALQQAWVRIGVSQPEGLVRQAATDLGIRRLTMPVRAALERCLPLANSEEAAASHPRSAT